MLCCAGRTAQTAIASHLGSTKHRLLLRRSIGHVDDGRVVRQCPLHVTPLFEGHTSVDGALAFCSAGASAMSMTAV